MLIAAATPTTTRMKTFSAGTPCAYSSGKIASEDDLIVGETFADPGRHFFLLAGIGAGDQDRGTISLRHPSVPAWWRAVFLIGRLLAVRTPPRS